MRSIIFRWVMRFAAAAVNSCSKTQPISTQSFSMR